MRRIENGIRVRIVQCHNELPGRTSHSPSSRLRFFPALPEMSVFTILGEFAIWGFAWYQLLSQHGSVCSFFVDDLIEVPEDAPNHRVLPLDTSHSPAFLQKIFENLISLSFHKNAIGLAWCCRNNRVKRFNTKAGEFFSLKALYGLFPFITHQRMRVLFNSISFFRVLFFSIHHILIRIRRKQTASINYGDNIAVYPVSELFRSSRRSVTNPKPLPGP